MSHAIDVREWATALGFFHQLQELAIEKYDVPDHEVAGIISNQRLEAECLGQAVGHRLFQ